MRTTLNIDDDVLAAAQSRARREKKSLGEVASDLMRVGLTGRARDEEPEPTEFLGFRPLPRRDVIVTNEMVDKIREEIGE